MNGLPKVELKFSTIVEDLNNGLTWLDKEDNGLGSIQSKYNATEMQISVLRQHPALKDVEVPRVMFTFIDDITPKFEAVQEEEEKQVEEDLPVVKQYVSSHDDEVGGVDEEVDVTRM